GSMFGYLIFGPLADRLGRRITFLLFFAGGVVMFPVTFLAVKSLAGVFLLLPAVGFFTLGVTSGFPIYLPELFPTRVRTTGVGFCYNLGRIVTAGGVFFFCLFFAACRAGAETTGAACPPSFIF